MQKAGAAHIIDKTVHGRQHLGLILGHDNRLRYTEQTVRQTAMARHVLKHGGEALPVGAEGIDLAGLETFMPGKPLILKLRHADGTDEEIAINHSYSDLQIHWFKAGSALNYMKTL